MTGLVRLLAAILRAHIERDDLPPAELVWPDERDETAPTQPEPADEIPSLWFVWEENARRIFWGEQAVRATDRPCWACGNPVGFHAEHRPCWDVPPFTRNAVPTMRTFADGGLL